MEALRLCHCAIEDWANSFSVELGVELEKKDIGVLRFALKRLKKTPEAKGHMERAFNRYESNGERWALEDVKIWFSAMFQL